jgi:hypothetical protein
MEAPPGIEPGCKDLQSSASPLRHGASMVIATPITSESGPRNALRAPLAVITRPCGAGRIASRSGRGI